MLSFKGKREWERQCDANFGLNESLNSIIPNIRNNNNEKFEFLPMPYVFY